MATDKRKHIAPAAGETPRRQTINDLSESINDFVPVANTTERAQAVADIGASTTRPLYVARTDAPAGTAAEISRGGNTFEAIPSYRPINARSLEARRTGTGSFGSGSMTTIQAANLPANAPAGLYLIVWTFVLSTAANTTANLRGTAGASNLTADQAVNASVLSDAWTIPTLYEHGGGSLALVLSIQIAGSTGTAPAGSKIVAVWQGPA